ncbi:glycosyl hydrolase family 28-related protein [Ningiella sp. W23]|uniref:glycosyl hydrolase family 28-related protein n=1 Tax=Ningiella sp. W23 TaxID=3023715 RepID=UPI003757506A
MKLFSSPLEQVLLHSIGLLFISVIAVSSSHASDLPKILSAEEHYLPDFSYAGYKFGIEPLPNVNGTLVDVTEYGAIANDAVDDSDAIIKAIEAANEIDGNVILRFPQGRFIISEYIYITRSNFVMQGAGRGKFGTTLYFPRPLSMVDDEGNLSELRKYLKKYNKQQRETDTNIDRLYSEYSWTGGFIWIGPENHRGYAYLDEYDTPAEPDLATGLKGKQGERLISVSNSESFKVGQRIEVLWHNRQGENGALVKSLYNNTSVPIGSRHWTSPERPLVKQRTQIVEVKQNTLTIADTLLHDVNEQLPVAIKNWSPLENIGLEGFSFEFPEQPYFGHHIEPGYNGVHITGIADSWIRNLSFVNADAGIISYDSANVTISDIHSLGDRAAHYAVHLGNVHNVLVQGVKVFNPVIHTFSFNTQSTRSVFKDSEGYNVPVLDQHAGANHQNLFDNITLYLDAVEGDKRASYPVFFGSGAGYWQPGHGRFNTAWNLRLIVESGAPGDMPLHVEGIAEGPDARIVGLSGNRELSLEYIPAPYVESLNKRIAHIPSLYDYQLSLRLR